MYHYVAIIEDGKVLVRYGVTYAEHFHDVEERNKRAGQFSSMSFAGEIYVGAIPPESLLARERYLDEHPLTEDMPRKQRDGIVAAALIAGDRAGSATVSILKKTTREM